MSFPRPRDVKANDTLVLSYNEQQKQKVEVEVEVDSSSRGRHSSNYNTTSLPHSAISRKMSKEEESDDDMFTVPDVEAQLVPTDSGTNNKSTTNSNANNNINPELQNQSGFPGKRRRGRNPVDKEYRRHKRLLRNRVSAQQARERKKVYVNDLESKAKELLDRNAKLEEKISILINENNMLRKVLLNSRPKVDEHVEPKQDQSGNS